jgi:hypothetical protein
VRSLERRIVIFGKTDRDLLCASDHMLVGDHEPLRVVDDTTPQAGLTVVGNRSFRQAIKEGVLSGLLIDDDSLGSDVHYSRAGPLYDLHDCGAANVGGLW